MDALKYTLKFIVKIKKWSKRVMIVLFTKTIGSAMEACPCFHNRKVLKWISQPKQRKKTHITWIQFVIDW